MGTNKHDKLLKALLEFNDNTHIDTICMRLDISYDELYDMLDYIQEKKDFLKSQRQHNGFHVQIKNGKYGVVRQFIEDGGFEEEKRRDNLTIKEKEHNIDLAIDQKKYNKITRIISIGAFILSLLGTIISLVSFFKKI